MTLVLEYHKSVRPSIPGSVAGFGSVAVALFLALPALAQINGAPASVTSPGFGGRAINGPRASVTSPGPQGAIPVHPPLAAGNGLHHHDGDGHHQRHNDSNFVGPIWYAVPVPYAVDNNGPADDQPEAADQDSDYQGGPTVFDRRGNGERSYVPPVKQAAPAHGSPSAEADEPAIDPDLDPDPPLPPTVLIFKDGHSVEVGNYAIQGTTLFDLTPGHRRKIAIADLDLEATRRQNDERGVTFQLPQSTRVN
jgi:hypothetical protein